jgi:hypothetical protein
MRRWRCCGRSTLEWRCPSPPYSPSPTGHQARTTTDLGASKPCWGDTRHTACFLTHRLPACLADMLVA